MCSTASLERYEVVYKKWSSRGDLIVFQRALRLVSRKSAFVATRRSGRSVGGRRKNSVWRSRTRWERNDWSELGGGAWPFLVGGVSCVVHMTLPRPHANMA